MTVRRPTRSSRWPVMVAVGLMVAVLTGCGGGQTERWTPEPRPGEGFADVSRGRDLYGQNCAACHGQQGEGTENGPSLVGVGAMSADFWVSTGRMPLDHPDADTERSTPELPQRDIDALVDYVDSLGGGPPIPSVEPGDVARGLEVFLGSCATCHSSSGTGGTLPTEQAPPLEAATATQIAEAIRLGPGAMPHFDEHQISDEDVNAVASYIDALYETRDQGGRPLGGVGPAAEGVVGWVFGVGVLLVVIRLLGRRAP